MSNSSVSLFPVWLSGIGVSAGSALLLFTLALFAGMPFWGRHLAGAFPFWVAALAITIRWSRQGLWRKTGRRSGNLVWILLLFSSLLIRFVPQHKHDDYRAGVAATRRLSSAGQTVWWVADTTGGIYYGLPLETPQRQKSGRILFAMNKSSMTSPPPDVVVISRPDNFDSAGTVSSLLKSGMYAKTQTLQAFEIWEKTQP